MLLYPWVLSLLLIVPLIAWRRWTRRSTASISYSSAAVAWDQPPTLRQRLVWLPTAMSLAALSLMIVSLARPRYGREQTVVTSEGIAIEMVVDKSGSMRALDFKIDGQNVDRLTAIKNVASKFVIGDETERNRDAVVREAVVSGRAGDLIGLVTFAGFADAITPPTLDHTFLVAQLDRTEIVRRREEDGTAIGDAISLAVDKLSSLERSGDESIDGKPGVQSKVIILLTDGENTAGEIDPIEAAKLAKTLGVKVYTIGVGTKGQAPFPVHRTRSGQILVDMIEVTIDEETLIAIADQTGGKYFRATDTDSLQLIYDEIDELEKTKVETQTYTDYRELAVQSVRLGGWELPPLLLIAFWLVAAAVAMKRIVFTSIT